GAVAVAQRDAHQAATAGRDEVGDAVAVHVGRDVGGAQVGEGRGDKTGKCTGLQYFEHHGGRYPPPRTPRTAAPPRPTALPSHASRQPFTKHALPPRIEWSWSRNRFFMSARTGAYAGSSARFVYPLGSFYGRPPLRGYNRANHSPSAFS